MASCTVSYLDNERIEHAVTVTAESLYEAAALGYEALASADLVEGRPEPGTVLEIIVHSPTVKHRVSVAKLRQWIERGGKSPREVVIKQRLKERLGL